MYKKEKMVKVNRTVIDGLAQEMYFNELYAYVLERIIEEMEFEEKEKL